MHDRMIIWVGTKIQSLVVLSRGGKIQLIVDTVLVIRGLIQQTNILHPGVYEGRVTPSALHLAIQLDVGPWRPISLLISCSPKEKWIPIWVSFPALPWLTAKRAAKKHPPRSFFYELWQSADGPTTITKWQEILGGRRIVARFVLLLQSEKTMCQQTTSTSSIVIIYESEQKVSNT